MTPTVADEPLLKDGDMLDADEFRRRYELMPEVKKAELIDGVVYMGSPVSFHHAGPHAEVITWAGLYAAGTPGVRVYDNVTVRLDRRNELQPDVVLAPAAGGRAVPGDDGYFTGPPEFVAEIAVSSVRLDRGPRLRTLERHGVREYLLVRPADGVAEWFTLADGVFQPHAPDPADGLVKSAVFPGLWLDPAALVRGDLAAVLAALQRGLASAAHAAFAARLHATAGGAP